MSPNTGNNGGDDNFDDDDGFFGVEVGDMFFDSSELEVMHKLWLMGNPPAQIAHLFPRCDGTAIALCLRARAGEMELMQ